MRERAGARFNKEVQPTELWIVLVYSTLSRLTEFSACTMFMKSHDQWSSEITIHNGNNSHQKDVRVRTSINTEL